MSHVYYTCLLNEIPHTVQSGSFRKRSYIDLPNRPDAPVKKSFIVNEAFEVLKQTCGNAEITRKKTKYVLFDTDYNIIQYMFRYNGIIDVQLRASLRVFDGGVPGDGECVGRRKNM